MAIYSASMVEIATLFCLMAPQLMVEPRSLMTYPEVDRRSLRSPGAVSVEKRFQGRRPFNLPQRESELARVLEVPK